MCGDIIDIVIPTNRELSSSDIDTFADPVLSGRYLITRMKHQVNHPTQQHIMIITAMKDSVTTSLPTKPIKYPIEKKKGSDDIGLKQEKRALATKPSHPSGL